MITLLTREPILTVGVLEAVLVAAVAFGADLDAGQVAALVGLAGAVLALFSRQAVVSPATLADKIGEIPARAVGGLAGRLVGARAKTERGSVPLGLIIFAVVIVALAGGIAVSCDAMFEDEDEVDDLGAPALILDHEDDWDGGSDGNSGGEYEGGRSGDDYDGDGDGNRCRNFCFYGVPYPGQPGYESQAIPSWSRSSLSL